VKEIYGFETQIKGVACTQEKKQEAPKEVTISQQSSINQNLSMQESNHNTQEKSTQQNLNTQESNTQENNQQEGQSASTIADIEAGGGASCVTNCAESSVQDETDGTDITKEPMVQKAIELFEATKITVQSKI
jgi:DNA polymerase-3 subunit gamma/tau